jgi:cobalamin synthase
VEGLFKVLGSAIGVIVAALSALVAYVQLKTPKPLVSTTGAPLLPVRVTGRAPWVGPLSRPDWNDVGMRERYFRRVRSWTRTALAVLILAFYGLLGLYGLGGLKISSTSGPPSRTSCWGG